MHNGRTFRKKLGEQQQLASTADLLQSPRGARWSWAPCARWAPVGAGVTAPCAVPCARPQLAAPCPRAAPARGDPAAAALRPGESGSPRWALMAQLANPSGSVWEEVCSLNVCHYQLMGMRVAGELGDAGQEGCAATGLRCRQPQES